MRGLSGYDLMRVGAAVAATAILTLICAACSATIDRTMTGSIPQDVEMLALPGNGGLVPMPPAWMRTQIEARMRAGTVPGYVEVTSGRIKDACAADEDLLGCVVTFRGLKVTYVRSGLSAETKHMVLVHEYAHDLYDWKH